MNCRVVVILLLFCFDVAHLCILNIRVKKSIDDSSNASFCSNVTSGSNCNLRSAFQLCLSNACSHSYCVINLPDGDIYFNSTLGPILASNAEFGSWRGFNIVLKGSRDRISKLLCLHPCVATLFQVNKTADQAQELSITINNIAFAEFGGLVFSLIGLNSALFDNLQFLGSVGNIRSDGTIYLNRILNVLIQRCLFQSIYSISSGGSAYIESSSNITILETTFSNGVGGALYLNNSKNITISSCHFENLQSAGRGVALFLDMQVCHLDIINCTFANLSGQDVAYINQYNHDISIQSSVFSSLPNTLITGLSIYRYNSEVKIISSHFHHFWFNGHGDDIWSVRGGGISLYAFNTHIQILSCVFENNGGVGGAIYLNSLNEYVSIRNTSFQNNISPTGDGGGAVYVNERNDNLSVTLCHFKQNSALKKGAAGGAIMLSSSNTKAYFAGNYFISNSASTGGALYFGNGNDEASILDSHFINNSVADTGGAMHVDNQNDYFSIRNTSFLNNMSPSGEGGGVYVYVNNGYLSVTLCHFKQNSALTGGGAIMLSSSNTKAYFAGNYFISNSASTGGALYFGNGNDEAFIAECNFLNNSATFGGAITFMDQHTDITCKRSHFSHNVALLSAGALFFNMFMRNGIIVDCFFIKNKAGYLGGGIVVGYSASHINLSHTYCSENTATFGGCLYVSQSNTDISISYSEFINNVAGSGGAVFFNLYTRIVSIQQSVMTGNEATWLGGALAFQTGNSNISIRSVAFTRNVAQESGGAVCFSESNYYFSISDCLFTHNYASSGGALAAIVFNTVDKITGITNSSFANNAAALSGGALFAEDLNVFIFTNCSFANNIAVGSATLSGGGAISSVKQNSWSLFNCNFANNTSVFGDGGAVLSGSDVRESQIVFCTFSQNSALNAHNGGAVSVSEGSQIKLLISKSLFTHNYADVHGSGGAIFLGGVTNASAVNCTFTWNSAGYGGAVALSNSNVVSISECKIEYNTGGTSGGGIYVADCPRTHVNSSSFTSNAASTGSALFLSNSDFSEVSSCLFVRNNASLAGTVYWKSTGTLAAEPAYLRSINHSVSPNMWRDNRALYGSKWATPAYKLSPKPANITGYRAGAALPNIRIYTQDFYGQRVVAGSNLFVKAVLTASFNSTSVMSLSGEQIILSSLGISQFSSLQLYGNPGHVDGIWFSASDSAISPCLVTISMRSCKRGEYFVNEECIPCGNGTYSLESSPEARKSVCLSCPTEAVYCYRDVISLHAGYWRGGETSDDIYDCISGPLGCVGGIGAGDDLCGTGHSGPLCAVCRNGYYLSSVGYHCLPCPGVYSTALVVTLLLVTALVCLNLSWLRVTTSMDMNKDSNLASDNIFGSRGSGIGELGPPPLSLHMADCLHEHPSTYVTLDVPDIHTSRDHGREPSSPVLRSSRSQPADLSQRQRHPQSSPLHTNPPAQNNGHNDNSSNRQYNIITNPEETKDKRGYAAPIITRPVAVINDTEMTSIDSPVGGNLIHSKAPYSSLWSSLENMLLRLQKTDTWRILRELYDRVGLILNTVPLKYHKSNFFLFDGTQSCLSP